MRILYIAHYKEFGGWSQAATDNILALDSVGVDVVCRNVTLTQDKQDVHPRLLALEKKDSKGCDICVQHVLPHHYVRSDMFKKNIALFSVKKLSSKLLLRFSILTKSCSIISFLFHLFKIFILLLWLFLFSFSTITKREIFLFVGGTELIKLFV